MVEEELDETIHWIEIIMESHMIEPERMMELKKEAIDLLKIIISSIVTLRARQTKQV